MLQYIGDDSCVQEKRLIKKTEQSVHANKGRLTSPLLVTP